MAAVDIVLTARARTETLDHCKEMQFDPLTNQSVVSDDLCMLKWGLAMTAVAISVLINLALDVSIPEHYIIFDTNDDQLQPSTNAFPS